MSMNSTPGPNYVGSLLYANPLNPGENLQKGGIVISTLDMRIHALKGQTTGPKLPNEVAVEQG